MKRLIGKKFPPNSHEKPLLKRSDIALTLVPAALWIFLVHSRAALITPRCITEPLTCGAASVFAPDRIVLGMTSPLADAWSFKTQFAAAWLALLVPLAWAVVKRIRLWEIATDLVILMETVLLNGVATEAIRLLVQRPRPFVYADIANLGKDPAHYTSFVSGHTSFTAAVSMCLLSTLMTRKVPKAAITFSAFTGISLIILTGLFRVLSGRHFVTDVLGGAVVGISVAFLVARLHQPRVAGPAVANT